MERVTWAEAVAALEGRALCDADAFLPLLAVAEYLAASRYARSLQAALEGDALVLQRAGGSDPAALCVRFDLAAGQIVLQHRKRPDDPQPWTRECGAHEWQAALERVFHRRLEWFHEG